MKTPIFTEMSPFSMRSTEDLEVPIFSAASWSVSCRLNRAVLRLSPIPARTRKTFSDEL
jgi:hypothetical protein